MISVGDIFTLKILKEFVKNNSPENLKKMVAYFDIDDTIILTSELPNLVPISEVFDIYNYLRDKGVKIAVITARIFTEKNLQITRQQLISIGFYFDILYLRPSIYNVDEIDKYKYFCRRHYSENWDKIPLCSIGDRYHDIQGGYNGIPFLVERNVK